MRFTVLGSGTTLDPSAWAGGPGAPRGPAGFLVQAGGLAWLVDGGSGTLQRCAQAGVDPCALAGGFYSHAHPDHSADLVPLLFTFRVAGRQATYPIHAAQGFQTLLDGLRGVYGRWLDFPGGATVRGLSLQGPDTLTLPGLTVRSRPAQHSAGALHLRFEADGQAVVFSGDTGPSPALAELATGADLLVCECAAAEDAPVRGHLGPSQVAQIVRQARPGAVWLTHLYPGVDPERAVARVGATGVPTRRAEDLDGWGRP